MSKTNPVTPVAWHRCFHFMVRRCEPAGQRVVVFSGKSTLFEWAAGVLKLSAVSPPTKSIIAGTSSRNLGSSATFSTRTSGEPARAVRLFAAFHVSGRGRRRKPAGAAFSPRGTLVKSALSPGAARWTWHNEKGAA